MRALNGLTVTPVRSLRKKTWSDEEPPDAFGRTEDEEKINPGKKEGQLVLRSLDGDQIDSSPLLVRTNHVGAELVS